ncbi:hypothetical protein DZJ_41660 [Dickeya ananatis]
MKKRWLAALVLLPFLVVFIAFQIAPLVWMAVNSFYSDTESAWGLANYQDLLTSPFYLQAMRFFTGYFILVKPVRADYRTGWRLFAATAGRRAVAAFCDVVCQHDQ